MPNTLDLFDITTAEGRFMRYHHSNPEVYKSLVDLARKLKKAGRRSYGIASLFEAVRWHQAISGGTIYDGLKVNNNYKPRYARLIMEREADLKDFFEVRILQVA